MDDGRDQVGRSMGGSLPALVVRGMRGLGDCIYQRAVVRELVGHADVYLETPWPQLVADLPVKCLRVMTRLRTQEKNARRPDLSWHKRPRTDRIIECTYKGKSGTMLEAMCRSTLGTNPPRLTFDLPAFTGTARREPYIVIRPATVRRESPTPARNPLPEYLARAADKLRGHFRIVSVADLAAGEESAVLPLPYADEALHGGELRLEQLLALIAGSSGVVSGVGWTVPAAVAYHVPLLLIYGGAGGHNNPARLFDSRIPTSQVRNALPDRFCQCFARMHDCDKRIDTIDRHIDEWALERIMRRPVPVAA